MTRSRLGMAAASMAALMATYSGRAHALAQPWQLNMAPGVTETSRTVYNIHMIGLTVCCVIGLLVSFHAGLPSGLLDPYPLYVVRKARVPV